MLTSFDHLAGQQMCVDRSDGCLSEQVQTVTDY